MLSPTLLSAALFSPRLFPAPLTPSPLFSSPLLHSPLLSPLLSSPSPFLLPSTPLLLLSVFIFSLYLSHYFSPFCSLSLFDVYRFILSLAYLFTFTSFFISPSHSFSLSISCLFSPSFHSPPYFITVYSFFLFFLFFFPCLNFFNSALPSIPYSNYLAPLILYL